MLDEARVWSSSGGDCPVGTALSMAGTSPALARFPPQCTPRTAAQRHRHHRQRSLPRQGARWHVLLPVPGGARARGRGPHPPKRGRRVAGCGAAMRARPRPRARATRNTQHASRNTQHATCNMQHATRNTQHATRNTHTHTHTHTHAHAQACRGIGAQYGRGIPRSRSLPSAVHPALRRPTAPPPPPAEPASARCTVARAPSSAWRGTSARPETPPT